MTPRHISILTGVLAVAASAAQAQGPYDPRKTFGPLTLPASASSLRTGSGTPEIGRAHV